MFFEGQGIKLESTTTDISDKPVKFLPKSDTMGFIMELSRSKLFPISCSWNYR